MKSRFKIDGIDNVSISFMAERMELEFEDVKKEEIMKKLNKVIKREEPDVKIEEV